jgi:hypothetical protein
MFQPANDWQALIYWLREVVGRDESLRDFLQWLETEHPAAFGSIVERIGKGWDSHCDDAASGLPKRMAELPKVGLADLFEEAADAR